MIEEINKLKTNFEGLKGMRNDIAELLGTLKGKLDMIHETYTELLQTHCKSMYMVGLDALHFQHSLIQQEYEALCMMNKTIENRLYCEYYKLHKQMQHFIKNEMPANAIDKLQSQRKYPVYRPLDTLKQYDFSYVADLHREAIVTIVELDSYYNTRTHELETDTQRASHGLNIDNLVNSYQYANAILKEKNSMYIRYLEAFHAHHTKYYRRLKQKTQLVLGTINEDIKFQCSSAPAPAP